MATTTVTELNKSERITWLIRLLWIAVALFALFLISIAVPYRYAMLAADVYGYGTALTAQGLSYRGFASYFTIIETAIGLSFLVVATIIAWRKTGEWLALMVAATLAYLGVLLPLTDGLMAIDTNWRWAIIILRILVYSGMIAMFCLFPDGRFTPRWSRWLFSAWLFFVVAGRHLLTDALSNMAVIPAIHTQQDSLVLLMFSGWMGMGILLQLIRYRYYASNEQRQQTKWVLYGFLLIFLVSLTNAVLLVVFPDLRQNPYHNFLYVMSGGTVILLATFCLAVTIAFAILRYHLWDIDVLINRTLVYSGLTAITIGIYVLLVGGVGSLLQAQGSTAIAFVATGVVAVLFQPLRLRLQTAVDHLMYGQRDDPVGMLTHLAQRLETVDSPERILPTLVETIATALKLPYVALWLPQTDMQWKPVAVFGKQTDDLLMVPLLHQNQEVGHLFVAPRGPGERFSREDERLLATIAQLSATMVQAVQLTFALQQSRQQIVTSQEEERRRLRRDLHDGLGPVLASVALQADTARDLVNSDPAETKVILNSIMNQAQTAVSDVRRLVYDLRPPTLDELGLIGTLRQSVRPWQHQLSIQFEAADLLPLPAAVEVAAYRIAQEAINNVVKHAQAKCCTIAITANGALQLVIEDDGVGVPETAVSGVGLISMKERAAELGGNCTIQRLSTGGTRVTAVLPLPSEE
ncbi:MAG: sensor histidine kinase [Ardenticatenaceae bacterium]|nr:sensor histidine kinase [Ardenticatenaceae bacterium]